MDNTKFLFDLIKQHKWDEFKEILSQDELSYPIDVNLRDNSNNYLIQYAILYRRKDIVTLLITKGSKMDIVDYDGRSILYVPIKHDDIDILQLLLHFNQTIVGVSLVDIADKDGNIPLHYAVIFNNQTAMELLLENESDPNYKNKGDDAAVHIAIRNKNTKLAKILLDHPMQDINIADESGTTPLIQACSFKNHKLIKYLLSKKSIDINQTDFVNEHTPLMIAIEQLDIETVKLLLDSGADPNIQDKGGDSALHYVVEQMNLEIFMLLKDTQVNPNLANSYCDTYMHLLFPPHGQYLEFMLPYINQVSLNRQNRDGNTLMHLILGFHIWNEVKDHLKKQKMNIHIKNYIGQTPMELAKMSDEVDFDDFMNVVARNYLELLQDQTNWKYPWENRCSKKKLTEEECLEKIKKHIIKAEISFPVQADEGEVVIDRYSCVKFSTFVGVSLDIIIGQIYLQKKHKNICGIIDRDFESNVELNQYYLSTGGYVNTDVEYLNFEIVWVNQRIFFPTNFVDNIKKCMTYRKKNKKRFVVTPLGIQVDKLAHAGYVILDMEKNEVERFEPHGAYPPKLFNYNPKLLDQQIEAKFNEVSSNIKYFRPSNFLPRIGFQTMDYIEAEEKCRHIGDPDGFCAAWSVWYADMRIKNPNISRNRLVEQLIAKMRQEKISFRSMIRNYSYKLTVIRDQILESAGLDINRWKNDKYTKEQLEQVNNTLREMVIN